MMLVTIFALVVFLAVGAVMYTRQRAALAEALRRDGFREHEIRKAMRLHARGGKTAMVSYCRDVIERRERAEHTGPRDWTKADSYQELV